MLTLIPLYSSINALNSELNPICHLLVLLEAHYILHVSRIRVNSIILSLTCFEQPNVHPQEDLYMQLYQAHPATDQTAYMKEIP